VTSSDARWPAQRLSGECAIQDQAASRSAMTGRCLLPSRWLMTVCRLDHPVARVTLAPNDLGGHAHAPPLPADADVL